MHIRLKKAVNKIIFEEPFIGSLLPRLMLVKNNTFPTMATDAKSIFWNEHFVEACDDYEVRGVTSHEIFHCIFLHPYRRQGRDPKKWSYACDYSVNPFIIRLPGCKLPGKPLLDEGRFPLGTPAEIIYDKLDDDEIPEDYEGDIIFCDGKGTEDGSNAIAEEMDWRGAVAVAATNAKKAGKLSGELEGLIQRLLQPKLPWAHLLYTWATQPRERRPSWFKPNRHYRSHGYYLPGKRKHPSGDFVLSYDVSGSMSDKAVKDSLTEVGYIINEINPNRVILIEHDSEIKGVPKEFSNNDELPTEIKILGRGGTDFNPVFNYVNELEKEPDAVILFTDGYGPHPKVGPNYPVLWVMVETDPDIRMNFGEQIWLDP